MASNKKAFALRLDESAFEKMKKIAENERRSINVQIEIAIERFINEYEREHGPVNVQQEP